MGRCASVCGQLQKMIKAARSEVEASPSAARFPCIAIHWRLAVSHRKLEDEGRGPALWPIPTRLEAEVWLACQLATPKTDVACGARTKARLKTAASGLHGREEWAREQHHATDTHAEHSGASVEMVLTTIDQLLLRQR